MSILAASITKQTALYGQTLIKEASRNPYEGAGNPEPLKHQFQGCWSRRINNEHRLVYIVTDDAIEIIACKYHYK